MMLLSWAAEVAAAAAADHVAPVFNARGVRRGVGTEAEQNNGSK